MPFQLFDDGLDGERVAFLALTAADDMINDI